MKGLITNSQLKIRPSKDLIHFILSLESEKEVTTNIFNIIESHNIKNSDIKRKILDIPIIKKEIIDSQLKTLHAIELDETNSNITKIYDSKNSIKNEKHNNDTVIIENDKNSSDSVNSKTEINSKIENTKFILELNDLIWIKQILDEKRKTNLDTKYLHEFLENCEMILPENEIIPRNPELEARCQKLKAELSAKEYRKMTKNVDASRKEAPEDSIRYQLKAINRQLIAVLQFIFSVAAGFAFGFIGVELIVGNLDFGFRLLLGVMCALTITVAEIYFLAKKLNEYDNIRT